MISLPKYLTLHAHLSHGLIRDHQCLHDGRRPLDFRLLNYSYLRPSSQHCTRKITTCFYCFPCSSSPCSPPSSPSHFLCPWAPPSFRSFWESLGFWVCPYCSSTPWRFHWKETNHGAEQVARWVELTWPLAFLFCLSWIFSASPLPPSWATRMPGVGESVIRQSWYNKQLWEEVKLTGQARPLPTRRGYSFK